MAGTDALTGARYPGSSDSPNVSQDIQNAVNDLSDIVGGIFTTISARDTAFSTWVAQGNTMRDGLVCRVGGRQHIYRSGSWHGVSPIAYRTQTTSTTVYTVTADLMTLSVPDPGFPYVLMAAGGCNLAQLGGSVTGWPMIVVNGTIIPPYGSLVINPNSTTANNIASWAPPVITGTLSGASTVTYHMVKAAGPAANGFQAVTSVDGGATDQGTSLWATVIPA